MSQEQSPVACAAATGEKATYSQSEVNLAIHGMILRKSYATLMKVCDFPTEEAAYLALVDKLARDTIAGESAKTADTTAAAAAIGEKAMYTSKEVRESAKAAKTRATPQNGKKIPKKRVNMETDDEGEESAATAPYMYLTNTAILISDRSPLHQLPSSPLPLGRSYSSSGPWRPHVLALGLSSPRTPPPVLNAA
ncbi:Hypothetical predicted protein [Lecanosticta acicola]|uniref:Uncharacterized protein n=1 Tax=Lecanosticta acicola TaxID=111012 RepID=A0AAI8YX56_9PEZI|nr:Hypothetical predicted protein [Lecanosticta acicola]